MNKLWPWFITILIISGIFVIINTAGNTRAEKTIEAQSTDISGPKGNCAISLPEQLDFAGEMVALEQWDVAEHLDRELLVNTYWHSSTIRIIKLANRWLPLIESILKKQGIPDDFKYLAIAESGLQNVVNSAGATGFWQFMPKTGREYNLRISSEIDQRYDVEASTRAACVYLKDAYKKFHSWTLAAASYNMGQGRLNQSLENQQVDSYYDLYLNTETSRYVFRILAFKLILSNPSKYGFCFDETDLYNPIAFKKFTLDHSIEDLAVFAKEQQTNLKMLKLLNPWIRKNKLTLQEGESLELSLPA